MDFGLRRHCPDEIATIEALGEALQIYSWTDEVYGEYRDIAQDHQGIESLLERPEPNAEERAVIDSLYRQLTQTAHRVGDLIPVLGRAFATDRQRMMLSEARDYLRDREGVGTFTRAGLADLLTEYANPGRHLIIVGHSLGSVIAYDTLWGLSRSSTLRVAALITIGSPLGTRFVRRLIKGAQDTGADRYPTNISRWTNIAAKGELTALYPRMREVFGEMLQLGMLESLEDHIDIYNHFVGARGLNVHSEYGYLIHQSFANALVSAINE